MTPRPTRRALLAGGFAAAACPASPAVAQGEFGEPSAEFLEVYAKLVAGRPVTPRGVALDMPRLAENGLSVPLTCGVESPMTETDHIRTLHLLSERNPIATVARFHFGPSSGRAEIETDIRLATSQRILALAETNDGRLLSGEAQVVVTLAACIEGG